MKVTIMKRTLAVLFTVVLAAAGVSSLSGQEGQGTGRVRGTVTDEENRPLADVKILMKSTSYHFQRETLSNQKGKWAMMGFSKDVFDFTFSKEGYETGRAQVFLSGANRNPDQDIVLKKIEQRPIQGLDNPADRETIRKASDFFEADQYAEAMSLFKEFVESHPDLYLARVNLAKTLAKLKQYPEAIAEYQKVEEALKADPAVAQVEARLADIYVAMAETYQDQGLFDQTCAYYLKAIELTPPVDPAVPFNLAELLFSNQRVDEAIRYYQLAIQLKPDFGLYELKLGYAFLNQGEMSSAAEHLKKFLALSPDDPQADSVRKILETIK